MSQSHDFYHDNRHVQRLPNPFPLPQYLNRHDHFCHNYDNGSVTHERGSREDNRKIKGEETN